MAIIRYFREHKIKYYQQFKKVIIVGGSSGIGLCLAQELITGVDALCLIARNNEKLVQAKEFLQKKQKNAAIYCFSADIANQQEIENALSEAITVMQGVDMLMVTAGIARPGLAVELDVAHYQTAINTNYLGSIYCVHYCLPFLQKNSCAKILLTSSVAGLLAIYGYSPYGPSKSALSMYGQILQQELTRSSVSLSLLYPPDTDTEQLHYEMQFKPEVTKIITGTAGLWKPEHVAQYTLKKLKHDAIAPGLIAKMILVFSSLLFPLFKKYARILHRNISKNRL
ncbi:SDR family NAD(P)-dependent oxidoreductase [Legionella sp. PATHC038]|uniref:SDR family NAD(P)-dependent oxidoreductase n=1 Tax=Legionella sheltonii TaxID=2992041 RepID=UPI00224321C8|nr:SDR family NAD(P)-dependent oxidoreductase [Legionella sp. PATHC038]MCW8399466.1 SDR family NAD(P)-dependent oxidoreductase [Legionella sp. PATHC038]